MFNGSTNLPERATAAAAAVTLLLLANAVSCLMIKLPFCRCTTHHTLAHMLCGRLNDDYVRSWTISSAPAYDAATGTFASTSEFTITVKKQTGGALSPLLHTLFDSGLAQQQLNCTLVGIAGDFGCYNVKAPHAVQHKSMLWIAAGSGITPFMSMSAALAAATNTTATAAATAAAAVMLFSADSANVHIADTLASNSITVHKFASRYSGSDSSVHARRLQKSDLAAVANLQQRTVYLCGPNPFKAAVTAWLNELGITTILQESFEY
jgi:uncharacterized protein